MTAHYIARRIRKPLGLAVDATYRAALFVAHEHDLIDPRGIRTTYELGPIAKAETVLCACAAGGGLTKMLDAFLAGARENGLARRLAALLDEPANLAEFTITFDATGRAIWLRGGVEVFASEPPVGRTFTISGSALAEALA